MWAIRDYRPDDFNFIAHSYLRSRRGTYEATRLPDEVYYPTYKERLETMLRISQVRILCAEDDPGHIGGYLITSKLADWDVVHYIYIKHAFRGLGLASALLKQVVPNFGQTLSICTHLPKSRAPWAEKYKLMFDPKYVRDK